MSTIHTKRAHKTSLQLASLFTLACLVTTGCTRFEGWRRPDITTGEPDQRNEINRGVLGVDDNFGTGMGEPVHHMDW
jgi:hypothetical protein